MTCVESAWDSTQQALQQAFQAQQSAGYSGPLGGWGNQIPGNLIPGWNGETISDIFASQDYKMPPSLVGLPPELQNTTNYIYVIDSEGTIWLGRGVHHPDLVNGANVYGAGEMFINTEGQIVLVDDWSGHYTPSGAQFFPYLKHLLQSLGIDFGNAQFKSYGK